MLSTTDNCSNQNGGIDNSCKATIKFGIFPGRFLRVILLETQRRSTEVKEDDCILKDPRFATIQAKWIVSLNQLVSAAIAALIREHHFLVAKEEASSNVDVSGGSSKTPRGIGLDTVVCLGGSLNETSVLNNFLLSSCKSDESQTCLVLGFDCTEKEMEHYIKLSFGGGGKDDTVKPLSLSILCEPKDDIVIKEIIKAYKISPTEWNNAQSYPLLEQAIINRIATKHIV